MKRPKHVRVHDKFKVRFTHNGKRYDLGVFENIADADTALDKQAHARLMLCSGMLTTAERLPIHLYAQWVYCPSCTVDLLDPTPAGAILSSVSRQR